MTYHFADLDPVVRELMLDELASDIADRRLYESKRAVRVVAADTSTCCAKRSPQATPTR